MPDNLNLNTLPSGQDNQLSQSQIHQGQTTTPVSSSDFLDTSTKSTNVPKALKKGKNPLDLVNIILLLAFLGLTGFGGYQLYTINNLETEIEMNEQYLEDRKNTVIEDNQSIATRFKGQFLTQKNKDRIFWSNVLSHIDNSITDPRIIKVNSISGAPTGAITINASTQSSNAFIDTANLITVFKNKSVFQNIFIPSVSSTVTDAGIGQLSYSLRFNYNKDQSEDEQAVLPTDIYDGTSSENLSDDFFEDLVEDSINTTPDPDVLEELKQQLNP